MGVRRSDWIVIGVDIGTEHMNDEWYEIDNSPLDNYDENAKVGELTYIFDGMGGEYFIVGEVLEADKENMGLSVFKYSKVMDTDYFSSIEKVKKHVKDQFGIECKPELIVLTHWT